MTELVGGRSVYGEFREGWPVVIAGVRNSVLTDIKAATRRNCALDAAEVIMPFRPGGWPRSVPRRPRAGSAEAAGTLFVSVPSELGACMLT